MLHLKMTELFGGNYFSPAWPHPSTETVFGGAEFTGSQTVSDQISDKSKLVIRLPQSPSLLISGSGSLAQLSRSLLPQKTYIFILIKNVVQFFECQIPETVLLTEAISICKRFSKVSHRCEAKMCGLSLLAIFTF